jgi:hypothetical protein
MSCQIDMSNTPKFQFHPNQTTFYNVHFKDNTYAYVSKETLKDIIDSRLNCIDDIIKFKYDEDFQFHIEITIYSQNMIASGDEYIKIYENLPQMYGKNPLSDLDRKIILTLNKNN